MSKGKSRKKSESCRVVRVYDEGLVEVYRNRVVVVTHRGHVVIHAKVESIEDPYKLLEECWW